MISRSDAGPGGSGALAGGLLAGLLAGFLAGFHLLPATALGQQEDRAEEPEAVEVETGDTLWGLAERYLGDSGRWQALYRANADRIADPHRLRPGVRLRLPADADPDAPPPPGGHIDGREEAAGREPADQAPRPRPAESLFGGPKASLSGALRLDSSAPPSRVSPSDYARAPFLLPARRAGELLRTRGPVTGDRASTGLPASLGDGDRVLLDGAGAPPEPGTLLQALQRGDRVPGRGVVARPVALLRVEGRERGAVVARVVRLFGLYRAGDPALPLPEPPALAGGSFRSVGEGPAVPLLGVGLERPMVRPGSFLFVDAGRREGLRPGDELLAPASSPRGGSVRLRVVRVLEESATVRVVELTDPRLGPGAEARLVRRLVGVEGG